MPNRNDSYHLNGNTNGLDRRYLIPDVASRLEVGDRKHAAYFLADLEQAALINRRLDISGAQNLRRLLDVGIDLSLLGRHADVGRQSIEVINNRIIAIEAGLDRARQSKSHLDNELLIENGMRNEHGLPETEPRFEKHELKRASKLIEEAQLHPKLPALYDYKQNFNRSVNPEERFSDERLVGHASADVVASYATWQNSIDRQLALGEVVKAYGEGIKSWPTEAQQNLVLYSSHVNRGRENSKEYMEKAILHLGVLMERNPDVKSQLVTLKDWLRNGDLAGKTFPLTTPYFRNEQYEAVRQYANLQHNPERNNYFHDFLRNGLIDDYRSRHDTNEHGRLEKTGAVDVGVQRHARNGHHEEGAREASFRGR